MRDWNLRAAEPLAVTLAADARLGPTDYCNDQIWELRSDGGEPPALALQTTYGLRARAQRIFARFGEGDHLVGDPSEFHSPPIIRQIYPNYLRVHFKPLPDLDVEVEYWVPASQVVAARMRLFNAGRYPRQIQLSLVAQLTPNAGQRMAPVELQAAQVLVGSSDDLWPVLFLTGAPQAVSSPIPALNLPLDLEVGQARTITWCHAALDSPEASFSLARQTAARNWEAEVARLELINTGQVEIYSGDAAWDAAFALAQKQAFSLVVGPSAFLHEPSFVLTRQPDQGFSLRGDGSDYNHLWNGQPVLEAYYLASLLLPGAPGIVQGFIRDYLATQSAEGWLDWKPGLGGQRSRLPATPLLATLSWQAYRISRDRDFLQHVFPALMEHLSAWFTERRDRDQDGLPEWDHPMQAGLEDHPLFSRWHAGAQGVEISAAESPALLAFLYRECRSLIQIALELNQEEPVAGLLATSDRLRIGIESTWDDDAASYRYRDRDSHLITSGELIAERTGPGELQIQRSFTQPVRLLVRVQSAGETTVRPRLVIYGDNASGQHRVEHVSEDRFRWFMGQSVLTGDRVYSRLERVEIQGVFENDLVSLHSVDFGSQDVSLFLPLWASIPEAERAEQLVLRSITSENGAWRDYGLPLCLETLSGSDDGACQSVSLPWNVLIGEGLVAYGYQDEAAQLVTRLMQAITQNLNKKGAFFRYYHAGTGEGFGERNALSGLAPLGLFLDALGVHPISPFQVYVAGFNPFPWPVTVKYRGLSILRRRDKTVITFPDGHTVTVKGPAPQMISLQVQPG